MKKHPKAGQPVKIANGPLAGKYFVVTDWLSNQYQGKSMEGILKNHGAHAVAVKRRGFPLDDGLVWGRLYPEMNWCLVHEKEILVNMKTVETEDGGKVELPPNVEPMLSKGKGKARMRSVKKESSNDPGTAS